MNKLKKIIFKCFNTIGYDLVEYTPKNSSKNFPADFSQEESEDILWANPYTMTSLERMVSLIRSTKYVVENKIPGDIVECGVWKGGSIMVLLKTLCRLKDFSREIFLYDTYDGMSWPTDKDVNYQGKKAIDRYDFEKKITLAPLDEVKRNVLSAGYPANKIHFIQGKVEDTIPGTIPKKISLLRLDTDWYESTLHELNHLYPLLSEKGVLIIDDYGHWQGAREATDQYFKEKNISAFLHRIDYTGRLLIRP